MSFTVGFDLDMTLIDPREGMVELFDVLARQTGYPLDGRGFVTRLGPPLTDEFARYGIVGEAAEELTAQYRARYEEIVIPKTTALPGAIAAVQAVADRGGDVIVVSGKHTANVQRHVNALGMQVTAAIGGQWAAAKAETLVAYGAEVYVGDHVGDVVGAQAADALAIGVTTGPIGAPDLVAAGADAVLSDLTEFPTWLDAYLSATVH